MSNNIIVFEDVEKLQNPESYRRLIGKLLYLTNTTLDITFGVHLLNKGNPAKELFFTANNEM